jgi:hypothetical protein
LPFYLCETSYNHTKKYWQKTSFIRQSTLKFKDTNGHIFNLNFQLDFVLLVTASTNAEI